MSSSNYAPCYNLKLSSAQSKLINKDQTIEVEMILDSGAGVCCIPESAIFEFEELLGHKLPFVMKKVAGFDGLVTAQRIYQLNIINDELNHEGPLTFVAIPGDKGLIGRELLNQNTLYLDGPGMCWQFLGQGVFLAMLGVLMKVFRRKSIPLKIISN